MGNNGFIVKNGEPTIDFLDPARAGSPDEAKLLREEYLKVKAELELLKSSQHNTRAKSREPSANFARTETAGDRGEPMRAAGSTTPGGRRASPKRSGRATVQAGLHQARHSQQIAALKSPGMAALRGVERDSDGAASQQVQRRVKYKKKAIKEFDELDSGEDLRVVGVRRGTEAFDSHAPELIAQ
jgi:hypothetical protein